MGIDLLAIGWQRKKDAFDVLVLLYRGKCGLQMTCPEKEASFLDVTFGKPIVPLK